LINNLKTPLDITLEKGELYTFETTLDFALSKGSYRFMHFFYDSTDPWTQVGLECYYFDVIV
jgi:hypothetical protein